MAPGEAAQPAPKAQAQPKQEAQPGKDNQPAPKHRMNKREVLPLAGIVVAAFIFNTSEFMPVALLSDIGASFQTSEAQTGMIISVYAWMVMILSLPLMILASRMEFRRLMLLVVAVFALGQFLSSVAASYAMLMAARIVVACAHAIFWSIASPMAIRVVSEDHRHAAMGLVVMGSSVALIAGLPLGRMVGLALGWRMTFGCVAVLSVAILLFLWRALPPIPATKPFSVKELPALLHTRALRSIYVFIALIITAYYICYSYIEPFLLQSVGMSPEMVTVVISLFGVAGIVGSMLFSKWYARLRLRFLFACVAGVVLTLFRLALAIPLPAAVMVVCAVLGACATAMNVALQSEVIRNARLDDQAVATSIYSGIFNLGIGSGSALGGLVVTYLSLGSIPLVGGAISVLALLYCVGMLLPRLRAGRQTA